MKQYINGPKSVLAVLGLAWLALGAAVARADTPEPVAQPKQAAGPSESMPPESVGSGLADEAAPDRYEFSTSLPPGRTSQYPSVTRLKAPKGWQEAGRIVVKGDVEGVAGPGDLVEGELEPGVTVQAGDRLYVLRRDALKESDDDANALYLQRVGVVKVLSVRAGNRVRCRVLKSGDAVMPGDLLSRESL